MSKVISFSISDRYLDKLRTLYPSLTDNLAAKQFLTDGLDGSLGNSLDVSLDDGLDDRVKTLIESWVDGLLDERLDATVGKSLTSLSERLTRLEARLDTNLDGSLDDMEPLLKLQRESSIATSPLPPSPSLPPDEPVQPAIETVTPEVPPSPPSPPGTDAIEDSEKKIIPLPDTLIGSPIGIDEIVYTDSSIEPDKGAIKTVPGDSDSIGEPCKGMNAAEAFRYVTEKGVKVSEKTLSNWVKLKEIPITDKGDKVSEYLILRDARYFPTTD